MSTLRSDKQQQHDEPQQQQRTTPTTATAAATAPPATTSGSAAKAVVVVMCGDEQSQQQQQERAATAAAEHNDDEEALSAGIAMLRSRGSLQSRAVIAAATPATTSTSAPQAQRQQQQQPQGASPLPAPAPASTVAGRRARLAVGFCVAAWVETSGCTTQPLAACVGDGVAGMIAALTVASCSTNATPAATATTPGHHISGHDQARGCGCDDLVASVSEAAAAAEAITQALETHTRDAAVACVRERCSTWLEWQQQRRPRIPVFAAADGTDLSTVRLLSSPHCSPCPHHKLLHQALTYSHHATPLLQSNDMVADIVRCAVASREAADGRTRPAGLCTAFALRAVSARRIVCIGATVEHGAFSLCTHLSSAITTGSGGDDGEAMEIAVVDTAALSGAGEVVETLCSILSETSGDAIPRALPTTSLSQYGLLQDSALRLRFCQRCFHHVPTPFLLWDERQTKQPPQARSGIRDCSGSGCHGPDAKCRPTCRIHQDETWSLWNWSSAGQYGHRS